MQVQAKLEANLEAGQRAWLQVQPTSGVITLKVLNSPQGGTVADASLEGLMRSLGFAETKENRAIVQALVSSNLPVNRDAVQSYAAVTQQLGADQGTLDAFLLALKRNLCGDARLNCRLESISVRKAARSSDTTFFEPSRQLFAI